MLLFVVYFLACLIVALVGRNTRVGAFGFFLLSLVFTPLIAGIVLLAAKPKDQSA